MKVFQGMPAKNSFINPVVTVGNFDGLHLGHQKILTALNKKAKELSGESVVITFKNHPKKFFNPQEKIKKLSSLEERINLFKTYQIDNLILLNFNKKISQTTALDFFQKFLIKKIGAKAIVIGHDHTFGNKRQGNIQLLKKETSLLKIKVQEIKGKNLKGRPISSSRIREALAQGQVSIANHFLGRPYQLSGQVVTGSKRGKNLGFPTANVSPLDPEKIVPQDGVYAVSVFIPSLKITKKGMLNIGVNPTFNNPQKSIEVNIFNFNKNIYKEQIVINFYKKIRSEKKFASQQELINQLKKDKKKIMTLKLK